MAKVDIPEELPSNSRASQVAPIRQTRRKKAERVEIIDPPKQGTPERVRGMRAQGMKKKRSFTQSIAEAFVGESSQNVGAYILYEVLLPAAKETIQSMVTTGIEMILFGEAGRGRSRDRDKDRTRVSYTNYYRGGRDRDDERRPRPRSGDKFDLNDIFFRHGDEAAQVLEGLQDGLEEYQAVSVADYFDMAGIDGATWAHNKYGWDDLSKAYCTHTRNGYKIVLPDPIELE